MKSAFMFPIYIYIFGNKQSCSFIREDITEDRGTWIQERPTVGPIRPERQN